MPEPHGVRPAGRGPASDRDSLALLRHVLPEDPLEMAPAKDEHVVQALLTHGADPPLREGVRHRRGRAS
jgi:hypothetical protein